MFASIHRTFTSDRGSTRWWAAIASAAMIVATASLPAVAVDTDPPQPDETAVVQVEEPAVVAEEVTTEPTAEEATTVEEPAVEEPAVVEPPVEEPAVEEPAVEEPAVEEQAVEEQAAPEGPAASGPRAEVSSDPVTEGTAEQQPAALEPMMAAEPAAGMEPAGAGGGDPAGSISLDFAAAEPTTYDHETGGGAWMAKQKEHVVESLEAGDFMCGEVASFLTAITVGSDPGPDPMTLKLIYTFTLDTTGQTGLALGPVTYVGVTGPSDTGNIGDKQSTVVMPWTQSDPVVTTPDYFVAGEVNTLTVTVDDLEANEQVIVRVDARISCKFNTDPTGNLYAQIASAGVVVPQSAGSVNVGSQTVPFKAESDLVMYGRLAVDKVTDPSGSTVPFQFRVSAPGVRVDPYSQTFALTDTATPWASGDIYPSIAQIGADPVTIAGEYTIEELTPLPSGWQFDRVTCSSSAGEAQVTISARSAVVTLHENELVTCTFENSIMPGSIRALKYEDLNGDGNRDTGEPVLPGWTIFMDENGNAGLDLGERSAVTDALGTVVFDNVMPGPEYRVCEVPKAGWINTEPGDPPNCWGDVLVQPGQQRSIEFGNFQLGTKSGMKFIDVDGDGKPFEQGVDTPKPGHVIALMEESDLAEGLQLPSETNADTVVTVVSTDAQGRYGFTSMLKPMTTYYVVERCPQGWVQTYPNSDGKLGTCDYYTLSDLPSDFEETDNDFGNFRLGSKSGYKWNDLDGDGTWDEGEPPIPGVTIELRSGDAVVASTTTDAEGYYEFVGLTAGSYTVAEVCKAGWVQTYPTTDGTEESCGEGVHSITVISGYAEADNNFGNFALGTKGGYKWNDLDGDGKWDLGAELGDAEAGTSGPVEPALEGWTINLLVDGKVVRTDTTDAEGYYEFAGLSAGTYQVAEACPAGWLQTFPPTSGPCGSGIHEFTVGSGFIETDNNFGNFQLGTKAGMKWDDLDGDGVMDAGEPPIAGWTITLWKETGKATGLQVDGPSPDTARSVTTDAAGKYTFGSLMAGTYYVVEACPAGWIQTFPNTDKDMATCDYYTITVTSGFSDLNNDFGNFKLGAKSGYKWNDVTPNGAWDTGEPGINGVTIQLWTDVDGSGTVTTVDTIAATTVTAKGGPRATDGYYAFTGLKAGKYVVAEVCQTGWVQSAPAPVGGVCGTGVHPITVASGYTDVENNFANYKPGVPTLDKSSLPADGPVELDDVITFNVTVGNIGGAVISGPVVDTLPLGLKAVAGSATGGGVISADGRSVTWQATLAPAASLTFSYQAEVVDAEVVDGQTLVNVATFLGKSDSTTHTVVIPEIIAGIEEEVVAAEEIAATGASGVGGTASVALLMMVAGGLMVVIGRRRSLIR